MDVGSPVPKLLASGHHLTLFYFSDDDKGQFDNVIERDAISDRGIGIIKFSNCLIFKFGTPGDETLEGHRYFNFGLGFYNLFEVFESEWIAEIKKTNKVHPEHSDSLFEKYKHYIITFHDNTFECVAKAYSESYSDLSMGAVIANQVNNLIESD